MTSRSPETLPFDRADTLAWLQTSPSVPVLIVGGGINGASVLRELAINGVDAVLVERGDFAMGATSASSRMIHGGLRYLENGEFRLVREALRERNLLLQNAPHAVFPLQTTIPLFTRFSGFGNAARKFFRLGGKPAQRGMWVVRVGLALYDFFARRSGGLPKTRVRSREETLKRHPLLHPDTIASASYFDAWNPSPERLCLEVIKDALEAFRNCKAINYCGLVGQQGSQVTLRDEVTGAEFRLYPSIVVNATGAWIDTTNAALGERSELIGGTKGGHLVVDHPELLKQLNGAELFYENNDGRICLLLPWHNRVLIGTTDIRIDDPDTAMCDEEEFAYLLSAVQQIFPAITINPEQVVARFSGVRPLPRADNRLTGRISRDHHCHETPATMERPYPILSLIGGKWTTFRAFGEKVADRIFELLQKQRTRGSADLAIGGGREFPDTDAARNSWIAEQHADTGIHENEITTLLDRYGTAAIPVLDLIVQQGPDGCAPIDGFVRAELEILARHEAVVHLDDLILRRTNMALTGRLSSEILEQVAGIVADVHGWSADRLGDELKRTRQLLRNRHSITI